MSDEEAPLIVGVCLANDVGPTHSHPLTTITLPPSHLSHSLTELRPLVTSSLPPSLRGRAFLFLSHHGWEIATAMESGAKIQQVCVVTNVNENEKRDVHEWLIEKHYVTISRQPVTP